jgi:hypothetical protein
MLVEMSAWTIAAKGKARIIPIGPSIEPPTIIAATETAGCIDMVLSVIFGEIKKFSICW